MNLYHKVFLACLTDFNTLRAKMVGKCVNYLLITLMNLWLFFLIYVLQTYRHLHMEYIQTLKKM